MKDENPARPRRSAGMHAAPRNAPMQPFWPPPAAKSAPGPQAAPEESASRFVRPKVLIDAVGAPKGAAATAQRQAFRAFMTRQRLRPTLWARDAGVPLSELLAFLTGRARTLPPDTVQKLAAAAKVPPERLFEE